MISRVLMMVVPVAMMTLTACYVESTDDRAPGAPGYGDGQMRTDGYDLRPDRGLCKYSIATGCFDGHVQYRKEFYVEGQEFFNADDLADRFLEVLTFEDTADNYVDGSLELTFDTPIDQENFGEGFEYLVTGERVVSGQVRRDGNFSINGLREGIYDLRLQRAIKFTLAYERLVQNPDVDPDEPTEDLIVEPVIKTFCGTLYQDATIEVVRGQRMNEMFDSFKLHVTDHECQSGGQRSRLTLD